MAATTVTNVAGSIPIKWQLETQKIAEGYLVADKFCDTKVMSEAGDRVRVTKVLRPTKTTTASTAGTLITASDARNLLTNYQDLIMEILGESFGFNEDVSIQSILSDKDIQHTIGKHMARSMDYRVIKEMSTAGLRWRIDEDATYQNAFTVTGLTQATGTPTTIQFSANTDLDQADDTYNGGYVCFTNPEAACYDQARLVDDSDLSDRTIVLAAADALSVAPSTASAPRAASKGIATAATGIVAGDVLTASALAKMAALHEVFEAEKFEGGVTRAFLHSAQKADLWNDTGFTDSATYDDSGRFKNYSVIRWLDNEFLVSSEIYRQDADGTENQSTGAVYVAPFFGKNAYSVVRFGKGSDKFGANFYMVDGADSGNLRASAKYLSWKANFAVGVTRATNVMGLLTGATSLGVQL